MLASQSKYIADTCGRVTTLEDRIEQQDAETSADETASSGSSPAPDDTETQTQPQTPLERIVSWPDEVVQTELTSNQSRARFIAQGFKKYASKAPAGYVIKSGEIANILQAGTDATGHTETVTRVMQFLDDLGSESAKIVKRRGTKRVVLTRELVERLERILEQSHRGDSPREKPLVSV